MATNAFIEIDLPEAEDFADLTGIRFDLHTARSFAERLKGIWDSEEPDWELVDPLSTAVLVRYCRPFATGVRKWLVEEALETLNEAQREKHERLRTIRNMHIAHSVNAFEESQPVARYWEGRVEVEGITSVQCNHTRVVGLSVQDVEDVIDLTTAMLSYVDRSLEREKAKVLEIVRNMPLEQVLSRAPKEPASSRFENIGRPRARRKPSSS